MEKKLPEYFPPSPRGSEQEVKEEIEEKDAEYDKTSCKLQDDGEKCLAGLDGLPTPDHTPTKNQGKKDNIVWNEARLSPPAQQRTLSKSHSESRLDSPRPTEAKLTKCTNGDGLTEERSRNCMNNGDCTADTKPKVEEGKLPASRTRGRQRKGGKTKRGGAPEKSLRNRPKSAPPNKKQEPAPRVLTDYFPVRRSCRMPSTELKKQQQCEMEEAILAGKEEGLKVTEIEGKGRGVVATKPFHRGDFVVEYAGDLIDLSLAKKREDKYSEDSDVGCYMYYFNHNNRRYCVDATAESGQLGRLLNHSKSHSNCYTKVIGIGKRPYLILMAAGNIKVGEELLYDYGDRSKSSVESHPWLAS